jgi:hypothetical protein
MQSHILWLILPLCVIAASLTPYFTPYLWLQIGSDPMLRTKGAAHVYWRNESPAAGLYRGCSGESE